MSKNNEEQKKKEDNIQVDEEGGAVVKPNPRYVVKSSDVQSKEKVFVNFTDHEWIEAPAEHELPQQQDQQEVQRGIRVPLSLGPPIQDFDNKGLICTVYDVIWNPQVLEKSNNDAIYRQMLIELCFHYISEKYKQVLDPKYKLPKLKYKGKIVQLQRIRAKKTPKIEVVQQQQVVTPEFTLKIINQEEQIEQFDGINLHNSIGFLVEIELPMLTTSRRMKLEISEESMFMSVPALYEIELW